MADFRGFGKRMIRIGNLNRRATHGYGFFDWVRNRIIQPVTNFLTTNPAVRTTARNLGNLAIQAGIRAATNKLPNKILNQRKPFATALGQTLGQTYNQTKGPIFRQLQAGIGRL